MTSATTLLPGIWRLSTNHYILAGFKPGTLLAWLFLPPFYLLAMTMMHSTYKTFALYLATAGMTLMSFSALAVGRMSQLVFSFPNKRIYDYSFDKPNNTIMIEIRGTNPSELEGIEHYDETVIRRVLVRDMGGQGTEVKFVLRDSDVRATVTEFNEPFRIAIDFFDRNFQTTHDPKTGMPLSSAKSKVNAPATTDRKFLVGPGTPTAADSEPVESNNGGTKRRLLQPNPKVFANPTEFRDAITGIPAGIGKHWASYPVYIYRIQTAAYHGKKTAPSLKSKDLGKAMTSAEAMADFAGRLFDFGHESRALIAYQQVLHKSPSAFERSPLHLWKFAEVHLGQGNLTLADGYFQALSEKHPESPLAKFAQMRRLDIRAIRAVSLGKTDAFAKLGRSANRIPTGTNGELKGQLAIRSAYWKQHSKEAAQSLLANKYYIPRLSGGVFGTLDAVRKSVEGQKTAFLSATLMLNQMVDPVTPWETRTGKFAAEYFKRYSGKSTEKFAATLSSKLQTKLNKSLQKLVNDGNFVKAIQDYESLPKSLRSVRSNSVTAWALAEAYRKIGQPEQSIRFYELAAKGSENGLDRLRSQFWVAVNAGETRESLKARSQSSSRVAFLGKKSRAADKAMGDIWNSLDDKEKNDFLTTYKDNLEATLKSPAKLATPAKILLSQWSQALNSRISAGGGEPTAVKTNFSPSANAVTTLTELAQRFAELGLNRERQQSLALLQNMKPKDFGDSDAAKKLWANKLVSLADEYRESSRYLEAGRIFAYAGKESEDWSYRAESLYKGGLLLYRAGRRDEAIAAFTKCSEDGSNRYYANLCTDRLDRLNKQ